MSNLEMSIKLRQQKTVGSAKGAVMVELSICLLVFLSMVYGIIWFAMALNARTAMTLSMGDALRYAVTRSETVALDGLGLPSAENDWQFSERAQKLMFWNDPKGDGSSFDPDYVRNFVLSPDFSNTLGLSQLPKSYLSALVYINEYMRIRVGKNFLRYPCSDKPGCFGCKFMRPDRYTGTFTGNEGPYADIPPADIVGLSCVYNLDFMIFNHFFGHAPEGQYSGPQIQRSFFVFHGRDT